MHPEIEIPDFAPVLTSAKFKVQLPEDSFHSFKCDAPSDQTTVTKDELMWMYERMVSADRGNGGSPDRVLRPMTFSAGNRIS